MSDAVLVAIITGLCAVAGQWLISRQQNEKRKVEDAVREARLEDRLRSVEEKLTVHNGYAEKLNKMQVDLAQIRKDIEYIGKA